jgi:DNA-binding transcriptional LysR family regulator
LLETMFRPPETQLGDFLPPENREAAHSFIAATSTMAQILAMDGLGEIGVFVRVVEARGFTRAGKSVGMTASGVSRVMSRLEQRLGARLLERTTRSIGLTAEGEAYYERCTRILRELEDANLALAGVRAAPRGRLRVDAPSVLGRFVIAPAVPRFLEAHPELSLELSLRDHVIDPIAEGIDVVVRMVEPRDSELIAKQVGAMPLVVVGSPRYLARRGRPSAPQDLRRHETIGFLAGGAPLPWRFRSAGKDATFAPGGRLHSNSADALRFAAISGMGLAQLLEVFVRDDLARGRLEVVLRDHQPPPRLIHALYTRDKATLPKVRVFLEFLRAALQATRATKSRRS